MKPTTVVLNPTKVVVFSVKETTWCLPDTPSRCKWAPNTTEPSPHHHVDYPRERAAILPDALHAVGQTPLIRINKINREEGLQCELLAKCEYFNPGGSVKDRIARRMVEQAERDGQLTPGMTIIEPTSGNTGIGLALTAAVRGYKCIIVMPEKMSNEKVDTLRALGAEIVRTPDEAAFNSPESHIGVAARLHREIKGSIILDQYRNANNPLTHYEETAEEILTQCQGRLDMVVMGAGTGGSISGIGRKLKEKCPDCKVIGVDPQGSVIGGKGKHAEFFEVEGIGYDFVPTVLDRSVVDEWVHVGDKDSFNMSRRLIREEGLLCGGSAGTAMFAAIQAAKSLQPGQRCVVLLADGIRNYMSKLLSDRWMAERNFIDTPDFDEPRHFWWNLPASRIPMRPPSTVLPNISCGDAIDIMKKERFHQLPVVDESGEIQGVVTQGNLISYLLSGRLTTDSEVKSALYKQWHKVNLDTPLGRVSRILDMAHFVLVLHQQCQYEKSDASVNRELIIGIITRIDLLNYVAEATKNHAENGQNGQTSQNGHGQNGQADQNGVGNGCPVKSGQ